MSLAPPGTRSAPLLKSAGEAVAAAEKYAEEIAHGTIDRDRTGAVAWDELAALDASGLLGITVPAAHGGPGLPVTVLAEVIRTIAATDPAIAQITQGHFLLVDVLATLAGPAQRERLFAEVLGGARFASALAERGGKHAQDLKTRLHREAGENSAGAARLDGRKYYCTGAISARWLGVSALDDDGRLVLAVVERNAPGVDIDEDWNVMGQRATVSGTATFENVPVDPGLVIDYQNAFERPQQLGARAQLIHTAIQAGIAGGALRDAREFVRTRARPFFEAVRNGWGDTAASDPHVTHRFGELATRVAAAEALLKSAAAVQEETGLVPADAAAAARASIAIAQAKAFASETAVAVASDLFSLTGASAADERHDLSRHWRNARTHASHDPVDWKYHHIGSYLLSDVPPPNHGQI